MRSETFCLITADSTHQIMKLEKLILENNIKVRIIPVPKEITANCGLSIKFDISNLEEIKLLLPKETSDFCLYNVEKSGLKKHVTKI
ncbi:DUF3343 domain-containing protein [uncultured Ilyobacter sp.]|jgi:diaminopimelate decarboxylase|uniref:DUF3343 domain-containing protein n=1 Tax=uncultured Ilyobacter sp. TaxID=544433 RepID=UPI0029C08054|nr:DUF3343 domain-containing protein [uncultured Ilyobacter sp.]